MRILPFSETLAHPGTPLPEHLEQVAAAAAASLETAGPDMAGLAALAGLCHDLGKASYYFQKWRLEQQRNRPETRHSLVGGLIFWWLANHLENFRCKPMLQINGLVAICRHHGNLEHSRLEVLGLARMELRNNPELYLKILAAMDLAGIWQWLADRLAGFGLATGPATTGPPAPEDLLNRLVRFNPLKLEMQLKRQTRPMLEDKLEFLAVFGTLLAADKLNAALQGNLPYRSELPADLVQRYLASSGFRKNNPASSLTMMRQEIATKVQANILDNHEKHFFTFTAPTGSGKTLSVLAAVLALRRELGRNLQASARIIYCLPFTSVIDQTHQVVAALLENAAITPESNILLKHHFLAEPCYATSRSATGLEESGSTGQLLTETWQSEIVVTTFHQLLNTFFSGANRSLKRTGQLANAIVILDEVQAVPLKYWTAIGRLFQAAARVLGTRFILMTATQPVIFGSHIQPVELLDNHRRYFRKLSRTVLFCRHHRLTAAERLADTVATDLDDKQNSTLVIVNRKKTVTYLYRRLKDRLAEKIKIFALSTSLTPLDRRRRIDTILACLKKCQPVLVISTQLVEAGVDISFPVVHRDLAPLDCIIQSCGRCNRHGAGAGNRGTIYLWQLAESKDGRLSRPQWSLVYDRDLIEVTKEILPAGKDALIPESDFQQLGQRYFQACRQRRGQIPIDSYLAQGDFESLKNEYRLIERDYPTTAVFVIQNQHDQQLWERYQALEDIESALVRRAEFLKFKFSFLERVIQVSHPASPGREIIALRADDGFYDPETGFTGLPDDNGDSPCLML